MKRMVEAVHITLKANETLGGNISGLNSSADGHLGRRVHAEGTYFIRPHWFWQGARLEYSIRKNAVRAAANAGGLFDIDQS